MVKIRLQRFGKKKAPFYHIVVADSKSPRDGKIIEQLGTYDPMTNPGTIVLDKEKVEKCMDDLRVADAIDEVFNIFHLESLAAVYFCFR